MAKSGMLLSLITADLTSRVAAAAGVTPVDLRSANATGDWPSKAAHDRARRAANALAVEAAG